MRSIFLFGIAILLLNGVAWGGGLTLGDATTSDIGYIYVWSTPSEGDIYVDGNYKGITDQSQYITISTTSGYHTVEIYKDGYDKYSTSVYIYSGQGSYVIADLNPTTGYIYVSSSPAGGDIYVDGNYEGVTDGNGYIALFTTPGYHTVEIYKDGYDKYSTSVYIYSGQGSYVIADLNPTTGYIYVSSSPAGGDIYIDGNYEGVTENSQYITIFTTPDYHTVEILKDGYDKYSKSVYVYSDQGTYVNANLNPTMGYIHIWSSPSGGDVYVDDNYEGRTNNSQYITISATLGHHTVEISKDGYDKYSKTVEVYSNQNTIVKADLNPTMGYIHIWSNQAEGDIYIDGNYEGITDNSQFTMISTTHGYHNIEIYKDGYDKYSTSVYVYSNQETHLNADLISNQTNWMLLISVVLAIFLILVIVFFFPKSKQSVQEDKTLSKYNINTSMIALIMFLTITGFVGSIIVENHNLILFLCYIFLILIIVLILGLIRRFWSPKEVVWAVGLVFVVETVLILTIILLTGYIETVFVYLITSSVLLIVGWVGVVFWVIQEWNLKIQSPIVKSQTFATETDDTINKPTKTEAPFMPISETHNEVCLTSASKTETISKSQRNNKKIKHVIGFKKIILLTILLSVIVIGSFGFTVYQKYSPLAELADCGTNCIDYKKVQFADYETSVPDIKIVGADIEKLIMDIPIVIHNPSIRDTETVKIDFDVYMEGRHLTKGVIPATELPAKQNTTIVIKDVEIKYKELDEVFQVLVAKHGLNMVREGKANISMTTDLLIYFPIEVFSINIYTFKIPVQIETEIPVDMLKQNEETKKQIEEKVKGTIKEVEDKIEEVLPALMPTEEQGAPFTFV